MPNKINNITFKAALKKITLKGSCYCLAVTVLLLTGCTSPSKSGLYKMTYYWTVRPTKMELSSNPKFWVPVLNARGASLGMVPLKLLKRLSLEGSGYLPNGSLVNLACECPYPNSRFIEIDRKLAPWGVDANSQPLIPFYRVAAPKNYLQPNTLIFLAPFKHLKLPDGTFHTGYFKVTDTGHSLKDAHLDIFVGNRNSYEKINIALKNRTQVEVVIIDSKNVDLPMLLPRN